MENSTNVTNAQSNNQQNTENQNEETKDDFNKYWPVFGRENPENKNKSFWSKGLCKDLDIDEEEMIMEGILSRIGRKKKVVKNYYYRLIGQYLCYYVNPQDFEYKGYLKLTTDVILEKKQLHGKKENFFYLEFSQDSNMRKLYSKQIDQVKNWYAALKSKSILTGFREQYKKIAMLGSGSFATVYQVERIEDKQMFAAKIYHKEKLFENKYKDKFVQMMMNEYECLRNVENQYIGNLYEVYQEQDYASYVMEFVGGGEVYTRLRSVRKFTEQQASQILYYVTVGLHCLHAEGYVHRDLKLENMMFIGKDTLKCKLIDFGFAEKINREELISKAGTPGFLPPELFKSLPYTEKGDIFGLGVILFCLVSGQSPFKGKSYKEVLENNRKCKIDFNSLVWQNISQECKDLVKSMLEPNPSNRCQTMEILKSPFIQKYIQTNIANEILNLKSVKSIKSLNQKPKIKAKRNKDDGSIGTLEQDSDQSYGASEIVGYHGTFNMKSLYNKSLKSLKSVKSVKSLKKLESSSDGEEQGDEDFVSSSQSFEGMNLSDNYQIIQRQSSIKKLVEDVEYNIDMGIDDHDLSRKLVSLVTPNKVFKSNIKRSKSQQKKVNGKKKSKGDKFR